MVQKDKLREDMRKLGGILPGLEDNLLGLEDNLLVLEEQGIQVLEQEDKILGIQELMENQIVDLIQVEPQKP